MKNARHYQRKLKKLLSGLKPTAAPEIPPGQPRVHFLIETILQADATRRQAASVIGPLKEEYVDLNELRVSPIKDITDCIGRDMPRSREKAEMIVNVLNNLFLRTNDVSLDWLTEMPRRELRRTLRELGLGPYAAAVALLMFGLPAVPVDETLLECLKADGYVHPSSDIDSVQAFLEKIVSPRYAAAAHEALRNYCEKRSKTLPRKPPPVEVPVAAVAEVPGEEELEEEEAKRLRAVVGHPSVPRPVKPAAPAGKAPPKAKKVTKRRPTKGRRTTPKSGRRK